MKEPTETGKVEVRRGFGQFSLKSLAADEFVTASGERDGGWIVWRRVAPSRSPALTWECVQCPAKFTDENSVQAHSVETGHAYRTVVTGPSEREAFEKFNESETGSGFDLKRFPVSDPDMPGEYRDERAQAAWDAWQARAAVPQHPLTWQDVLSALKDELDHVVFMSGGAERAARRIAIAEREKFVRWAITAIHATEDRDFNRDDLGHYRWTELDAAWKAWQARAAIIREETGTQERDAMLLEFINEHHSEQRDPNCHICKTAMKIEAALPAAPDEGGTR